MRDRKYKILIAIIALLAIILVGVNVFYKGHGISDKYTRESTRKVTDLGNTEFIKNLQHGNSYVPKFFGGHWSPMVMPIKDEYKGLLKEKIVFMKEQNTFTDWDELLVFDVYTNNAFPNISSYLKKHAQELHKNNPDGKIKILHDGDKCIIYQWAIIKDNKTKYLEFGKVEMTTEGLLSVKYINKGTDNLESQRQKAIKFFTKF